ncbi:hypothetical protein GUITHDRAFT_151886 [Guillardia theta CCMP2712]|uniref:Uncharacterized protein n=1 Tax=Guillardia theta (strain CCMP2712) TaxID=905079 RepID=L1JJT5_GUITC|nr:hypothetical protein GUITHDRAFT_151886 [Guillardia theta CCMP2712]EKX48419.1 hypothetical protein GUITHDRAFT_151886 [Guillardia theta CCMP2712]|eukprot:XP_005835399.1 hypothetical protein GUITHDRAFT_151886 [Guillardia theta CCMP2712]
MGVTQFEVGRFYKEGIGVDANMDLVHGRHSSIACVNQTQAVKYFKAAMDPSTDDHINSLSAYELAKIYIQVRSVSRV